MYEIVNTDYSLQYLLYVIMELECSVSLVSIDYNVDINSHTLPWVA